MVKIKKKPRGRPFLPGQPTLNPAGRPRLGEKPDPATTTSIKKAFLQVFDRLGGAEGMCAWVLAHPRNRTAFYGWISKLLPKIVDIQTEADSPLEQLLLKYQDINGRDLEQKAAELAGEVSRTCRVPVRIKQA